MPLSEEARRGLRRRLGGPAAALDPDTSYARRDAGGSVASSSTASRPKTSPGSSSSPTSSLTRFYFALAFEKLVLALLLTDAGASILRYVVGRETAAANLPPGLGHTAGTAAASLLGALAWAAWALSAAEAGVFVRDGVETWWRGDGWATAGEAAAGGVEWQDASAWLWRLRVTDALAVAAHGGVLLLSRGQASRLWLPALRVPLRMCVAGLLLEGELDHRTQRAIDAVGRYLERVEVAVTQGAKYEHAWLREVEAREALARDVAALESAATGSAEMLATLQEALLVAADDMAALEARLPPPVPSFHTHGMKPTADESAGPTGEWRHAESPTASVGGYRTPPDDEHWAAAEAPFSLLSRAAVAIRAPNQRRTEAGKPRPSSLAGYGTRGYSDGVDVSDTAPVSDMGSAGEDVQSPGAWEDATAFERGKSHSPVLVAPPPQAPSDVPTASWEAERQPGETAGGGPAVVEQRAVAAPAVLAQAAPSVVAEAPGQRALPCDAGAVAGAASAESYAGRAPSQSGDGSTTADVV